MRKLCVIPSGTFVTTPTRPRHAAGGTRSWRKRGVYPTICQQRDRKTKTREVAVSRHARGLGSYLSSQDTINGAEALLKHALLPKTIAEHAVEMWSASRASNDSG